MIFVAVHIIIDVTATRWILFLVLNLEVVHYFFREEYWFEIVLILSPQAGIEIGILKPFASKVVKMR
jgi:hypothetical protein